MHFSATRYLKYYSVMMYMYPDITCDLTLLLLTVYNIQNQFDSNKLYIRILSMLLMLSGTSMAPE